MDIQGLVVYIQFLTSRTLVDGVLFVQIVLLMRLSC